MTSNCAPNVASYPAIYLGNHYGNRTSGWSAVQVSAVNCSLTSWNFTAAGSGSYNISYDLWFCPSATCNNGWANGAELMVWLNWTADAEPAGTLRASNVSIAGYNWDVWIGPMEIGRSFPT